MSTMNLKKFENEKKMKQCSKRKRRTKGPVFEQESAAMTENPDFEIKPIHVSREKTVEDDSKQSMSTGGQCSYDDTDIRREISKEKHMRWSAVDDGIVAMCTAKEVKAIRRGQQETLDKIGKMMESASDEIMKELEEKTRHAVSLLEMFKKDWDDSLKEADELTRKEFDTSSALAVRRSMSKAQKMEENAGSISRLLCVYNQNSRQLLSQHEDAREEAVKWTKIIKKPRASRVSPCPSLMDFSVSEIDEAIGSSFKLGEGRYASVYQANLRNRRVMIKKFRPPESGSALEFRYEVTVLSNLRHPNLVIPIGACMEAWALVYENLPSGNLENRLDSSNSFSSPPLTWEARSRIASEICSALAYLHSHGVVHGSLHLGNILLDSKDECKMIDFGIPSRTVESEWRDGGLGRCCPWEISESYFVPPSPCFPGKATTWGDLYALGAVMLSLLTGKRILLHRGEVRRALKRGKLKDALDPRAGDWPLEQTQDLARLALCCTNYLRLQRPTRRFPEIQKVVESMRMLAGQVTLPRSEGEGEQEQEQEH